MTPEVGSLPIAGKPARLARCQRPGRDQGVPGCNRVTLSLLAEWPDRYPRVSVSKI